MWSAPANNGGSAITGYNVRYSADAGNSWTDHPFTGTGTSTTITSLDNGQPYQVQVQALNVRGPGAWSTAAMATPAPAATAPAAPDAPTLTPGDGQLEVSWDAPSSDGGSPITGYNIQYRTDAGSSWDAHSDTDASTTTTTITSLTNGQRYEVQVQAVNAQGPSAWSASATATPATVPAAPDALALTPGDGQLALVWSAPANNGGSAITGYNIQYSTDAGSSWAAHSGTDASTTTTTITGLTNGQRYEVQVRAVNVRGPGAWSHSTSVIPGTVPAAPDAPALTPGDGQLALVWRAPADNGGAAITDYNVHYSTDAGSSWANHPFTGTGTSTTITSLDNGQSYQVQVQAVNAHGPGAWSTAATATPATVPAAPDAPALTPGDGQLEVAWSAPGSDGGSAITGYNIQYSTDAGSSWAAHSGTDASTTTTTITGLTNGQRYEVQVQAVNAQGPGAWSTAAMATPAPGATAPAAPAIPTLRPGDRQLEVSWHAPGSDGGSTITGYNVQYKLSGAVDWTDAGYNGAARHTTLAGLTNGPALRGTGAGAERAGRGPLVSQRHGHACVRNDAP